MSGSTCCSTYRVFVFYCHWLGTLNLVERVCHVPNIQRFNPEEAADDERVHVYSHQWAVLKYKDFNRADGEIPGSRIHERNKAGWVAHPVLTQDMHL